MPNTENPAQSQRPLRIAIIANSFLPYLSGVTISIDTLTKALRDLGHQVKIFAPAYPPGYPAGPKIEDQIEVFRFPSLATPFYPKFRLPYAFLPTAKKELLGFRPEIIHCQTPFLTGWWGQTMARRLNLPCLLTFHTLFTEYLHYLPLLPPALTKRPAIWYLRAFAQRCDAIIVPSQPIKKLLADYGVAKDIQVIPTGLPPEQFYPWPDRAKLRSRFNIPAEAVLLINAGRLGKEKNLDLMLDLFSQIHRQARATFLLLVGGGPAERELKEKARQLGLGNHLIFIGEVPHEKIGSFYQAADIFLATSLTETQGLVLTEAKAAGLPVVAINAFGTADMVQPGRDGYLCDQDNFGSSVLGLVNDPVKRQQMAQAAFRDAQDRFSSQAMAQKTLQLYSRLLSERPI